MVPSPLDIAFGEMRAHVHRWSPGIAARGPMTARRPAWSGRHAIAGAAALAVGLAACGEEPANVSEVLTEACGDAREQLAAVPAPLNEGSDTAFLEAADQAAGTVVQAAEDLVALGDDRSIADLIEHLRRFPDGSDADRLPRVAYETSAAIVRIDVLADTLAVPECGAATWRPADWRAMAAERGTQADEAVFRQDLNRLCAATFPDPSALADETPLLEALVERSNGGDEDQDPTDVRADVLERLNTVSNKSSDVPQFIREFSDGLRSLQPSAAAADGYVALLAAFLHIDTAVPNTLARDPSQDVRDRVYAALDDLEDAWHALDITC